MHSPKTLRRIGLMERFHVTRTFLGLDTLIISSAQYTTEEGTALTPEILFPALRILIEAHAPLGLQITGDEATSNVFWIRLPSVDLSRMVEFSGKRELTDAYQDQFSRPIKTQTDLPLWRLEVLADNTVIFATHHVICDGTSLLSFHMHLFRALQETSASGNPSPLVPVPTTTVLLPAIECATDVRPSLRHILQEFYKLLAPVAWTKASAAWTGHPNPHTAPQIIKTHIRLLTLPAAESQAFLAACRAHSATITAALYVLTLNVFSQLLPAEGQRYKRIAASTAVSLRDAAGFPRDAIIDYPSSDLDYPRLDPMASFSWSDVTRKARELQALKRRAGEQVGMLAWLFGRYVPYMREQLGKKRNAGFCISNIGRFDTPHIEGKARWCIGNTVFAQSDVIIGPALSINVTGDPSGGLNFTFGWTDTSLDTPFVEKFIEGFQEAIMHII